MAFDRSNVQGLSVVVKKMQNMVLVIFKVSEHNNQPELEHELLPQYVIDTGEHDAMSVSSEMTFFSMKMQSAICPQLRTE